MAQVVRATRCIVNDPEESLYSGSCTTRSVATLEYPDGQTPQTPMHASVGSCPARSVMIQKGESGSVSVNQQLLSSLRGRGAPASPTFKSLSGSLGSARGHENPILSSLSPRLSPRAYALPSKVEFMNSVLLNDRSPGSSPNSARLSSVSLPLPNLAYAVHSEGASLKPSPRTADARNDVRGLQSQMNMGDLAPAQRAQVSADRALEALAQVNAGVDSLLSQTKSPGQRKLAVKGAVLPQNIDRAFRFEGPVLPPDVVQRKKLHGRLDIGSGYPRAVFNDSATPPQVKRLTTPSFPDPDPYDWTAAVAPETPLESPHAVAPQTLASRFPVVPDRLPQQSDIHLERTIAVAPRSLTTNPSKDADILPRRSDITLEEGAGFFARIGMIIEAANATGRQLARNPSGHCRLMGS